jgi:tRNA(fMet)-specific endonuclease VapC
LFLFDTDHVAILQNRTPGLYDILSARVDNFVPRDFFVSIVTFQEQVAGWQSFLNHRRHPDHIVHGYAKLSQPLRDYLKIQIADFGHDSCQQFDELRKQRIRIGTMDLRIASIVLVNDYTVLTRNLVDFEKVPGLKVEDWTAAPDNPR